MNDEIEEIEEIDEYTDYMERPYEKLIVWQEAYSLCLLVYKITVTFPSHERFSLTNQMRRSAYSVPINIAEGNARRSVKEKTYFCRIAQASLEELHCESQLARDLSYLTMENYQDIDDRIQRVSYLLTRLIASLQ